MWRYQASVTMVDVTTSLAHSSVNALTATNSLLLETNALVGDFHRLVLALVVSSTLQSSIN